MFRIKLINMPFAALNAPSLALTQLKSVLDKRFRGRVSVDILYLNQEFARFMGVDFYEYCANSADVQNSGLGEWLFRQSAFPELGDNMEEYFQRYFPHLDDKTRTIRRTVQETRRGISRFLINLIEMHGIDRADIAGFTSMFYQNVACFAMARKIKEANPGIVTVMGGSNCEPPMGEEIKRNVDHIDYVFSGPALRSFPEFVQHCLNGEVEKCSSVKGVLSHIQSPSSASGGYGSIGDDLDIDENIRIDYGSFLNTLEKNFPGGNIRPKLFFETSRGCWWGERVHCTFCGLNGTTIKYRVMSPENAVTQFASLFGYADRCSYFKFVDNAMPTSYLKDVFPRLSAPPDISMHYEVRVNMSLEDLRVLSKAGVRCLQPGIESLATDTLKLMKKGTTAFQNILFLKNCVAADIEPDWSLLIGSPGEGEDVYAKYVRDLPLLVHLPPPKGAFPIRFCRYSPYFLEPEKYGLDLRPYDFYEMIYPFSRETLANIAYYFMDLHFDAEYFRAMVKWIAKVRETVSHWQRRWTGSDNALPAKLYFKEDGKSGIIRDSRTGQVIEHMVSEAGRTILERLNGPENMDGIAKALHHLPHIDPGKEIASLRERGLVYEEHGRFMSLVHAEEPRASFQMASHADMSKNSRERAGASTAPSLVPLSRKAYRISTAADAEDYKDSRNE